jgi:hypothetical protein
MARLHLASIAIDEIVTQRKAAARFMLPSDQAKSGLHPVSWN